MADRRRGMPLILNMEKIAYAVEVSTRPEPKLKDLRTREQKVDRVTQLPMWVTDVTVKTEQYGAQVISVTTLGQSAPQVSLGDLVEVVDLEAMPWTNKDRETGELRSGVAFRATELRVLNPVAAAA